MPYSSGLTLQVLAPPLQRLSRALCPQMSSQGCPVPTTPAHSPHPGWAALPGALQTQLSIPGLKTWGIFGLAHLSGQAIRRQTSSADKKLRRMASLQEHCNPFFFLYSTRKCPRWKVCSHTRVFRGSQTNCRLNPQCPGHQQCPKGPRSAQRRQQSSSVQRLGCSSGTQRNSEKINWGFGVHGEKLSEAAVP